MNVIKKIQMLLNISHQTQSKNEWVDLFEMDNSTCEYIEEKHNLRLFGFKHLMDIAAIKHIKRKHGDDVKERYKGQLKITDDDFLRVPEILKKFDNVEQAKETKTKLDSLKYTKKIEDLNYTLIEEIRTRRKKLALKTLYKKPLKPKGKSG